ncbi:MAG TPA: DNA-processing protein DprA [Ktedonobacteraceae bacterium]|nr:DNA-processing protein DprA [Ktedonobacteraceae bacterium]
MISGNAKGVDRSALEGVMHEHDYTTVILPHGIHKLSKVQMSNLLPGIEDKKVLLLSQFPPNASWLVSRAMERNHVVTGLAQMVVVAQADGKGGTWEGANNALCQGRRLYVCQNQNGDLLPGNALLIEKGGHALSWPAESLDDLLLPLVKEIDAIQDKQQRASLPPNQLSLLALPEM